VCSSDLDQPEPADPRPGRDQSPRKDEKCRGAVAVQTRLDIQQSLPSELVGEGYRLD